jgi:hypothetical protein
VFCHKHNLPDVLSIVCDLAVDRLQHSVRLTANRHRAHGVFWLERIERRKHSRPSFLPPAHHFATRRRRVQFKLLITMAVGLFTVAGEEIREARAHIARQMLDQYCNGVRLWIHRDEQIFLSKLRHCSFAHALVTAQLAACFIQICPIPRHPGTQP